MMFCVATVFKKAHVSKLIDTDEGNKAYILKGSLKMED